MRSTRRLKKYTYWLRLLLDLWDRVLLLGWKVVCYPWQKSTRWQKTSVLIWDWKVKGGNARGRSLQARDDPSRRRSSTRPLMGDVQDERPSPQTSALEHVQGQEPGDQTRNREEHGTLRDEGHSRIAIPTLQLPTPMYSYNAHSRPPSPSSDTS